jgi:hypothetical protein
MLTPMEAVLTVETRPMRKQSNSTGSDVKDPTNAAHVPPSVLADTIGHPTILHGDKNSDHAKRHGSISHQERHI